MDKILNQINHTTYKIEISGIVQGVGFRPFIYRIAAKHKLNGAVSNTTEGVIIKINTENPSSLDLFIDDINSLKPGPSIIETIRFKKIPYMDFDDFTIKKSIKTSERFQLISPDIATCGPCLEDINNKNNSRRYYYPFTNCTNCGPRFTIIKRMPYDRPQTTMAKFKLCKNCLLEYNDPPDRRFHAQPNACSVCGPKLMLVDSNGEKTGSGDPIINTAKLIKKGKIVAIKSLGGFQIACDGTSDKVVSELRRRKRRPVKPFAVMFGGTGPVKKYYEACSKEIESLASSRAPIVLLRKKKNNHILSRFVSFYNLYEGIMLPYTPIHHLLFNHIDGPLVMTSGNISEEPIAAENIESFEKLKSICDYYLIHNRDIYSRYDDSVIKIFNGREMVLRRARGYSPYPVKLKKNIGNKTILSVGAQEKNTFCFLKKNYAIISQHIGDLDNLESIDFFKSTLSNYKNLFNIENIDLIACDCHPDHASSRIASKLKSGQKTRVQHHRAHLASVIAENQINDTVCGFSWDGTGLGDDGKIWGSEIFVVDCKFKFERVGHLSEKILPGGRITIKKPYRMAITYLYYLWEKEKKGSKEKFPEFIYNILPSYKNIASSIEIDTIEKQIKTQYNSPVTTSMGRFFDAVSSLLDLTHINTFEGEAAIHMEMVSDEGTKGEYRIEINRSQNKAIIDDFGIITQILEDISNRVPAGRISAKFHNTLTKMILNISQEIRKERDINKIALSGGVFQNNLLLKKCFSSLRNDSFEVFSNFMVPVNDGGISLGQAYIAAIENYPGRKE